jgi:hypothetical protein
MKRPILPRPKRTLILIEVLGILFIILIMTFNHVYKMTFWTTIVLIEVYVTVLTLWQYAYTETIEWKKDPEAARAAAHEKERKRREKHDAKVAVIQEELAAMNEEVPAIVASILKGMSLGDQRVYHTIRRSNGIQAQDVANILPELKGVERPSLATVKRSIAVLTKAGLIERDGSKKTGQYIVVSDDEVKIKF